jgi:hypothetical protein
MRRTLLVTVGLAVALCGLRAAADTLIEVLPVRNRPAADLVPPLEAILGDDATVTAIDNRLVVRASRAFMPEVRRLVEQLDVSPRSLWITVRQEHDREAAGGSAGASVAVGSGGVAAGGHLAGGRESEVGGDVHQVRALEGTPAWITMGAATVSGTTYQQVERGFWVVARVAGDRVTLDIETALDEARATGTVETQGVGTTASGRLGEWISLGEIGREGSSRGSGILSASQARHSDLRTVDVKVDEVR